MKWSQEELTAFFEYLDELRASGETNMFGCGPYLEQQFDLARADARQVALAWMRTFDESSASDRARAAAHEYETAEREDRE